MKPCKLFAPPAGLPEEKVEAFFAAIDDIRNRRPNVQAGSGAVAEFRRVITVAEGFRAASPAEVTECLLSIHRALASLE